MPPFKRRGEMVEISLCMIVKNEEDVLARCLDCVKDIVDEIIIVDTGSTDHSKDIALKYTDKVFDFEWVDDFSKARNESFAYATKDYILWLDADDIIDKENQKKLLELKTTLNTSIDVVMMKYMINDELVFYRERLLKREKGFQWQNAVHEVIEVKGNIIYQDIQIEHHKEKINDANRNLRIYEKQMKAGKVFHTREMFYYARELYEHQQYDKAINIFQTYLSKTDGWVENQIEACLDMAICFDMINKRSEALQILFYSFLYDLPRSEILCEIGHLFLKNKQYHQAIYWYQQALKQKPQIEKGGFIQLPCYDFIPYIQLCVCYDRLNNQKKAQYYNELAGQIKPQHPSFLHNQKYFESIT